MEIPDREYMSVNEFDKSTVIGIYRVPPADIIVYEIDRAGDVSHWMFDKESDGYARLIRVRFIPENNFISIWW